MNLKTFLNFFVNIPIGNVYDGNEIKEILGKIGDYKKAFQGLLQTLEERLKRERLKE